MKLIYNGHLYKTKMDNSQENKQQVTYPIFVFQIVVDIVLGVLAGLIVNICSNLIEANQMASLQL